MLTLLLIKRMKDDVTILLVLDAQNRIGSIIDKDSQIPLSLHISKYKEISSIFEILEFGFEL